MSSSLQERECHGEPSKLEVKIANKVVAAEDLEISQYIVVLGASEAPTSKTA